MSKEDNEGKSKHATEKLPPGMVLGPDGKPCKICTVARNWRPYAKAQRGSPAKQAMPFAAGLTAASQYTETDSRSPDCPPDVEQLGRATWTFLHTTAAYYPEKPSVAQRAQMLNMLHSLPTLYPCSHCASHLNESIKINPPDVSSRIGLSRWLCNRHNEVNERLGKAIFDCSIEKTDERWKDGPSDGRCD